MEWPEKNLVLHGAAFTHGEQADGFLTGFTAPADGKLHIGLLHGEIDPSEARYDPIRKEEIAAQRPCLSGAGTHPQAGGAFDLWRHRLRVARAARRDGGSTNWGKKAFIPARSTIPARSALLSSPSPGGGMKF